MSKTDWGEKVRPGILHMHKRYAFSNVIAIKHLRKRHIVVLHVKDSGELITCY